MNLPASSAGGTPRRNRSFPDSMTYYHEHYLGLTRGELRRQDASLYQHLRRNGLLKEIPKKVVRSIDDPVAYYREHYAGVPRSELKQRDRVSMNGCAGTGSLRKSRRRSGPFPTPSLITRSITRE